jgi:DNA-directed RNA polymerase specialized sigma24 family protein
MAQARRMAVGVHDRDDVMHDAFRRILETLPTERGELAERAWHSFCRREATEAWRDRFGRRGERVPREEAVESGQLTETEGSEKPSEEVLDIEDLPPWHVVIRNDNSERIEWMARQVVEAIPDEFVREVASRAWFSDVPAKVSGTSKPGTLTLTEIFTGKTRHQIQRALAPGKDSTCSSTPLRQGC